MSASVIRSNADEGSDRAIATDASANGEQLHRALITVALLSAMRATTIMLGSIWLIIGLGHLLVLRFVFDRSVAVQA